MESMSKKKKKPKANNIYDIITVQHNNNSIINIKQPTITEDTNKLLPGLSEDYMNNTYDHCELCWNCFHSFTGISKGIPLKYSRRIFYIYGYFCSYECGARYIFEMMDDNNKWDNYALLNLYYNISEGTCGMNVKLAPNKLSLDVFGGDMDIATYRSHFSSNVYHSLYIPPIIPISHEINSLETKHTQCDNKDNFKLYRKKPINSSNNIYETMNLTMNA